MPDSLRFGVNILGESTVSYDIVKRCYRYFKCGRRQPCGDEHTGGPRTVINRENVKKFMVSCASAQTGDYYLKYHIVVYNMITVDSYANFFIPNYHIKPKTNK